jgi:FAS-associated factor 2
LPRIGRVIERFGRETTLTGLFMYVDSQMIPGELERERDPLEAPSGASGAGEAALEVEVGRAGAPEGWWGFKLLLAYPRQEIKWEPGKLLRDVPGLSGGGQIVVELVEGRLWGEADDSEDDSDG